MLVDVWLACWFKGVSVGLVLLVCKCVVGFFKIMCIYLFWLIVHVESSNTWC
jgi:hypothetical protein